MQRVPAHVAVEAVSVLTRLPGGYAVTVVEAGRGLRAFFPSAPLVLDAAQHLRLLDRLAEAGIAGGRIYDALIGVTASEHGHELTPSTRGRPPSIASSASRRGGRSEADEIKRRRVSA